MSRRDRPGVLYLIRLVAMILFGLAVIAAIAVATGKMASRT